MAEQDLLVEIGTEELPPKALKRLSEAFEKGVRAGLDKAGLGHGPMHRFATPRRLAVLVESLAEGQADKTVERKGPAVKAAYNAAGEPTGAALGFARSCGVPMGELETVETGKGAWLVFRSLQKGQATPSLVPDIVTQALTGLPIPKRMRWADLNEEFVRPVHWVVMLYGDRVVPGTVLGVAAGRRTRGHRFHHPDTLEIQVPADYPRLLEEQGKVVAEFGVREAQVRRAVETAATQLGGTAVIDPALLEEVTSLVEWPVAVAGSFEARFLKVPAEALIATMKGNQKYFHVVDEHGGLMPNFIAVANIESRDPAAVLAGNERVIRPRLADAEFFWNQDRATPLAERVSRLKDVVFQQKLGTLRDKSRRVAHLAETIATGIGAHPDLARRAAELSKCDLLTDMVGEFPALQGTMGRYYALHDGEPDDVAAALDEQYQPRFAGDTLPGTATGQALAIADRLDTLTGIFGVGQVPSGDKDPFGLRRTALGVLRILVERHLDLDLMDLLERAARGHEQFDHRVVADGVFEFMMDRLRAYYLDQGIAPDTYEAVLTRRPTRPLDFDARVHAVESFRALPEAESLAAANKRISNILRKAGEPPPNSVNPDLLLEASEQELAGAVSDMRRSVAPMLDLGDYGKALARLADLGDPVDRFFDQVLVMAEDPAVRANRLALLEDLRDLFLQTADVSRLQLA